MVFPFFCFIEKVPYVTALQGVAPYFVPAKLRNYVAGSVLNSGSVTPYSTHCRPFPDPDPAFYVSFQSLFANYFFEGTFSSVLIDKK